MSDKEFDYDNDQEVSKNHSKLIEAVRLLDKTQRVKKPERSEPSLEVSEFHLVKSGITDSDAVLIQDLTKPLEKKSHHADLSKKIKATKSKTSVLSKPLEKPAAERIKRQVGFENIKKELGKWSGIIARNRTAASVSFPLSQISMKLVPADEFTKKFRLQSELEKKLAELDPPKEPEEEKDEFPLTLEEILERRREAAKFRAQESYKVAKAHRQRKIKSKKFHRIQRKERIKKALKEFEELEKTDPEAALEKLEQLDRARAEERITLRHKNTGQWARSKQVRAKYDKESRQVLAEQLSISRELTQKVKKDADSDEDDNEDQLVQLSSTDKENPWMNAVKSQSEIEDFISGYRKFWDEKNKKEKDQNQITENGDDNNSKTSDIKKVFEEPEINVIPAYKNPVEKVDEKYQHAENGFIIDDISDEPVNSSKQKKKKKLQKKNKYKLGIRSPKSKVVNSKKLNTKAGTSNWSISTIQSKLENGFSRTSDIDLDLDEMFDSVDDKLQEKINRKRIQVERMLVKEMKMEKKRGKKRKTDDSTDDVKKLELKGQKNLRAVIDKPLEETSNHQATNEESQAEKTNEIGLLNLSTTKSKTAEIDPNKFMNMKPKHVKTMLPDEVGGEEEILDDEDTEEKQHEIISEAFADDDVVDEFRKEKEEEIKKSLPEDIDLHLPGWGSWGGKDIKSPSRKRRRFILKFPKEAPRRDENKGDVVIIEEKCPKIKHHLVNEVPFPFTSVQDYEASLRAPIGREFVPEKTFSKLVQPAVKTMMGKVIEPMSEEALVKKTDGIKKRKKAKKAASENNSKKQKPTKNANKIKGLRKRKAKTKKTN